MSNDIQKVLDNLRSEFIIIALTGALGSGCTQTAKFLFCDKNFAVCVHPLPNAPVKAIIINSLLKLSKTF